jgi:hypothetical protein
MTHGLVERDCCEIQDIPPTCKGHIHEKYLALRLRCVRVNRVIGIRPMFFLSVYGSRTTSLALHTVDNIDLAPPWLDYETNYHHGIS